MTEEQWLCATDPTSLWDALAGRIEYPDRQYRASPRKQRLFGAACCYRIRDLLPDEALVEAVACVERRVDGGVDPGALKSFRALVRREEHEHSGSSYAGDAIQAVRCLLLPRASYELLPRASYEPVWVAEMCARAAAAHAGAGLGGYRAAKAKEQLAQCALLRDVINPYWRMQVPLGTVLARGTALAGGEQGVRVSVALSGPPADWLEHQRGVVPRLVREIYDKRSWDALPILADALEEAGCEDAALLGHLRGPGPHVRGCWALDWILGKE